MILDHLDPTKDLWDIGCDHGYLGKAYLNSTTKSKVYFIDKLPHVLEQIQLDLIGNERAVFICHNAKKSLDKDLSGNVVLAGMGAKTILEILRAQNILAGTNLILNPFKNVDLLETLDFDLIQNWELREGKRLRHIFHYVT